MPPWSLWLDYITIESLKVFVQIGLDIIGQFIIKAVYKDDILRRV
uniref:Uncharacterized protein n=1 Tax=Rhizophora mucronata TaxID=61149 RepID=A0A2P2QI67_RHIMU